MSVTTVQLPSPALSDISDGEHGSDYVSAKLTQKDTDYAGSRCFMRHLGNSELSYYLPSRENGVNDMYLHLGFHAPAHFVGRARMSVVWAILRLRHPLLASRIVMYDYNDVQFVYTAFESAKDALIDAACNLQLSSETKDELIDTYLNGPRILSNDRLSYLILSQPGVDQNLPSPLITPSSSAEELESNDDSSPRKCELLICAAHFLGDGMALHQFANDFFGLLGSTKTQAELEQILEEEWQSRWGSIERDTETLPKSVEDCLPLEIGGKLYRAACLVDFQRNQEKQIGGHVFPRKSGRELHTVVPTVPFGTEQTPKMLKACKARGVSISAAMFAICNIAWARMVNDKLELPVMMYSALNMRPYLIANKTLYNSYWFLAVGYFNVILPAFLPHSVDASKVFWHRARAAKDQSTRAAKNSMVVSRCREMARERGARARIWAKEDDDKANGVWQPPPSAPKPANPKPPSAALIGLSLLGNLDGIYKHSTFPEIKLHTLTTGSRQRPGGMLLFSYTFAGRLWVSLGYDENGFDKEVVDKFWRNVLSGIEEFLLD